MTIAKELLEVDTAGNEVHVQQDRGEHVSFNSMAASEINRDAGIKKQGEESEEETLPAAKSHCQVRPRYISMTMPKELPEMGTDKNVHAQDGKEHVAFNSMADVVLIRRSVRLRPTTRTTDPLSLQMGVGRKIPMKKKKGYLKNRLE